MMIKKEMQGSGDNFKKWTIDLDMEAITEAILEKHIPEQFRECALVSYSQGYSGLLEAEITYEDWS